MSCFSLARGIPEDIKTLQSSCLNLKRFERGLSKVKITKIKLLNLDFTIFTFRLLFTALEILCLLKFIVCSNLNPHNGYNKYCCSRYF